MPDTVGPILENLGIREFDDEIFGMSYSKLREHFGFASGGLNTSLLLKNLIWQDHGKILRGEIEPIYGNIRSYWYTRAKPVLARARAKSYAQKYDMMINQFVLLVVHNRLLSYADFGFTDEGAHNRQLGRANRHIFCVSEKVGHMPLLELLYRDYDITIVALGGQPSALSSEYLVAQLEAAGFSAAPDQPIPLLTIVDYDPSGDSIARSLTYQLGALGLATELVRIDLVHPSRMTPEQIRLNKYQLSRRQSELEKNRQWAARTGGLTAYGHGLLYGLEADAMTWEQLTATFYEEVLPLLDIPRDQIVRQRLKRELVEVLRELLLLRLGVA